MVRRRIEAGELHRHRSAGGLNAIRREGDCLLVQAGASLAAVAAFARDEGLSGMAELGGIPGTVGGGVLMNAGAYGAELAQLEKNPSIDPAVLGLVRADIDRAAEVIGTFERAVEKGAATVIKPSGPDIAPDCIAGAVFSALAISAKA